MVIYKNDVLCVKSNDKSLLPIGIINENSKYKYVDDYGFKECGMMRYYLSRYEENDIREVISYDIGNYVLIWDFDCKQVNSSLLVNNNLYLVREQNLIWNMKEAVGYDDTCVGVNVLSSNTFYFATFSGLGFKIKVDNDKVIFIEKNITK